MLALGLIAAGVWLWRSDFSAPPPLPASTEPQGAVDETAPAASAEPAIKHPIETPIASESAAATLDVDDILAGVFGRMTVGAMFQTGDFAHRFVATVDNLGRSHAPARLWPVNPALGQFMVAKQGEHEVISADNGERYTTYVLLAETVDLRRWIDAYVRLYPSLQRAYEELGFPHRYFNDRLVEVIDLLLATPQPSDPIAVHLPPINGPIQPARPWVLYEFDDPAFQQLASGQRILLRMGPLNERRAKAKLAEIRHLLTAIAAKKK